MVNYNELKIQLKGLIDGDESKISILSNASALINISLDNLNWCGFYILKDNFLYLGPFQGKPACIKIKVGNGVCGTTIKENKTIVVNNWQ
jgi:GAF domain-containing protein